MRLTAADRVWNRAALESGGTTPRSGDCALAALLRVHGLVMNGGVHHAIECLAPAELAAAADGFLYFGFDDVASFLGSVATDSTLSPWTEVSERTANERYAELIPDDSLLVQHFERLFHERPGEFDPINHEGV